MEQLQTLGLAFIGLSHTIWILITPVASCWQAMAFHRVLALAAGLASLYALIDHIRQTFRKPAEEPTPEPPPLACPLPGPVEFLANPAGQYMAALRRGAAL